MIFHGTRIVQAQNLPLSRSPNLHAAQFHRVRRLINHRLELNSETAAIFLVQLPERHRKVRLGHSTR